MTYVNHKNLAFVSPTPDFPVYTAMDATYADRLVNGGEIRLYLNSYYQTIEHQQSRDAHEGVGILNCRGTRVTVRGLFSTFVWCASQATLSPDEVAHKYRRNTVVVLEWPHILAERLLEAAYEFGSQWSIKCKPVVYDKGSFRDHSPEADEHDDGFYVFQKDPSFSHEKEYRYALTDLEDRQYPNEYVDLKMRSCRDIMQIYRPEIPTRASRLKLTRKRVSFA